MNNVEIINSNNYEVQKNEIYKNISNNKDLILVKNFCKKNTCSNLIKASQLFSKKNEPFSNKSKKYEQYLKKKNFWEYRVLPIGSKTSHLYRIFHVNKHKDYFKNNSISNFLKKYVSLQYSISDKTLLDSELKINPKIIHYPQGGGFFNWHTHKRYPQNYGLILSLSKKNKDYGEGTTLFKLKGKLFSFEKILDQGDLILFKYNIQHSVSKVDPYNDLTFNNKGRWTCVMPIY